MGEIERSLRPLAFFDSGIGGLPYLEVAKRLMPGERYLYLADRAGFPYGDKSPAAVAELALKAVAELRRAFDPKAVVVACNTASAVALAELRAANPGFPIVGTVPAVKPAAASSRAKRVGVVATARTAADPYLAELIRRWAADCAVTVRGDQGLVAFVEDRWLEAGREERLAAARPAVEAMIAAGADAIVLGCTHFLYLAPEFAELAGPGVRVVDSRDGVAAQLRRVVSAGPGLAPSRPAGPDLFFVSGAAPLEPRYAATAARFGLERGGSLYR